MRVDLFDFELPTDRIALRPASPRDAARLLRVGGGGRLADHEVRDLPGLLRAGDVLVFNDTRVIPAQLEGRRGEARIGATLHKREGPRAWRAFVRNAKRLKAGDRIDFGAGVAARAGERGNDGTFLLVFEGEEPVELLLERAGRMPLPPYLAGKRQADERDRDDYQTMFAREEGAVAAPTAALHFTPALMAALAEAGIGHETLTLHVGAGTFLPVKADDIADHVMHAEWGRIDWATASRLNAARAGGGRLIAVGTTSLRLLESAADEDGQVEPFEGDTAIFITPGYRFRAVDGLVTNFHLPRSTLFMLVSALMGLEVMQSAYAHAIAAGYRFYSYGDASLLLPDGERGAEIMAWKKGRGLLGPLRPLLGDWRTQASAGSTQASAMACTRRFSPHGKGWIALDARWQTGPGREYRELALFGPAEDGTLGFFSFTSDGKRSVGLLADGSDVHPDALAFEAQMPAGLARMVYWPLKEAGPGFQFAVENRTKQGWNRFLCQHFGPAD